MLRSTAEWGFEPGSPCSWLNGLMTRWCWWKTVRERQFPLRDQLPETFAKGSDLWGVRGGKGLRSLPFSRGSKPPGRVLSTSGAPSCRNLLFFVLQTQVLPVCCLLSERHCVALGSPCFPFQGLHRRQLEDQVENFLLRVPNTKVLEFPLGSGIQTGILSAFCSWPGSASKHFALPGPFQQGCFRQTVEQTPPRRSAWVSCPGQGPSYSEDLEPTALFQGRPEGRAYSLQPASQVQPLAYFHLACRRVFYNDRLLTVPLLKLLFYTELFQRPWEKRGLCHRNDSSALELVFQVVTFEILL